MVIASPPPSNLRHRNLAPQRERWFTRREGGSLPVLAIDQRDQGVPDVVLLDPSVVVAGVVPPEVVPDEAAVAGAVTVMS
jgi:hypothetical protein